ncbi:GntR family transcriptional regulator [Nocardioides bruguierae]|uniref:GntR family transcriptional regulator n=1 Tax=Nocardioides bruguierae TaxID=2945102 RepID=A0A9X2DAR3_9ACTN|nr:GntR family transcriptional regulator [Nocardioides bruguierae]MCM0622466.1 GntR family transcriptional regulator [Nocardioides bruguierae]
MASARDTVYETLRVRLTQGHYPPDASLVPQALSEEFSVSRTPVREALGLLERDGLLVATSRGFALRRRSDEEVLEIFEVRAILESSAAEAAALRRSPVDLARLRDLVQRARGSADPAEARIAFNGFHDAVRQAAHNETITGLIRTLTAQVKLAAPWHTEPDDASLRRSLLDHEQVLAAIEDGDGELARTRMLEHLAHDRENRISQLVARAAGGSDR